MWQSMRIVIIDDKQHDNHPLEMVLSFVGERCTRLTSGNWHNDVDADEVLAVVIDASQVSNSVAEIVSKVSDWKQTVPIIVYADASHDVDALSEQATRQLVATLDSGSNHQQWLNIIHLCQLCHSNNHAFDDEPKSAALKNLVGNSPAMGEIRKLISQVAKTDANVLILGESGTGKEVVAQNLHRQSNRADAAFVPINCGAIPAELLESELFGHEKGAFTGAITTRQGRFELAKGGTIFLDEIGDMPMPMQVKLLRVLQERVFERVGSMSHIEADVRIIAATHRDLDEAVAEGKFREDLYYRLNVFPIEMPPLKDRAEDVPLLMNNFTKRLQDAGMNGVRFTPNAMVSLTRHDWPGNVRELANLTERMSILFPEGIVDLLDLPAKYKYDDGLSQTVVPDLAEQNQANSGKKVLRPIPDDGFDLKNYLVEVEKMYINQALEDCGWVVARAAKRLGMRRTTLVEKMRKHEIQKSVVD